MKKVSLVLFMIFISFSLVSSLDVSLDNQDEITGVDILVPEAPRFNNATAFVNKTNFWDDLDDPSDINHNLLSNLAWSVAGHTIDTDFDIGSNTFKGKFNWTTDDPMLDFDGRTLDLDRLEFNDSVKNLFTEQQVVYNASTINVTFGDVDSGIFENILVLDGNTYNVSEVTGTPGFTININFTNVVNFNVVALRGRYEGGSGHTVELELYRVGVGWEERAEITDQMDFGVTTFDVFIGSNFIDDQGVVQFRLNHDDTGSTQHDYFLDAVFIGQVTGLVSGGDLADLTGRDEACDLLPDVFCKDGSKNMTGNFSGGGFDIIGNYFFGDGSQLTGVAKYQFLNNNFNGSGNFNTTGNGTFNELTLTLGTNTDYKFVKGTLHASEMVMKNQVDGIGRIAMETLANDGGDNNFFRVYGSATENILLGYASTGVFRLMTNALPLELGANGIIGIEIDATGKVNVPTSIDSVGSVSAGLATLATNSLTFGSVASSSIQNTAGSIQIEGALFTTSTVIGITQIGGNEVGTAMDLGIDGQSAGATYSDVVLGAVATDWVIVDSNLGLNVTDIIYADRLVLGQGNESVNSTLDISSGDIVGNIAYFNAYMGRSLPTFCDMHDLTCTFFVPKYHTMIDVDFNEDWTIQEIFYENSSYTKQEFNSQVCLQNQKTQDICNKLNQKFQILKSEYDTKILLQQQKDACGYVWKNRECFENVLTQTDYNGAVESYDKPIMEEYGCIQLNNLLQEESSICLRESGQTEIAYRFKENCNWDNENGYYCRVRELRNGL